MSIHCLVSFATIRYKSEDFYLTNKRLQSHLVSQVCKVSIYLFGREHGRELFLTDVEMFETQYNYNQKIPLTGTSINYHCICACQR